MLKVLSQFDCNVSDFFTFTLEIFFFDQTDFCIVGINPVVKLFGCQYDFLNMYTDRSPVNGLLEYAVTPLIPNGNK